MAEVSEGAASTEEAAAGVSAAQLRLFNHASVVLKKSQLPLENSSKGMKLCCAMQSRLDNLFG